MHKLRFVPVDPQQVGRSDEPEEAFQMMRDGAQYFSLEDRWTHDDLPKHTLSSAYFHPTVNFTAPVIRTRAYDVRTIDNTYRFGYQQWDMETKINNAELSRGASAASIAGHSGRALALNEMLNPYD